MRLFILLLSISFCAACRNNKSDQPAVETDTVLAQPHFIWQTYLNDSTGRLEFMPSWEISPDSLQPAMVVDQINRTNKLMEYGKIEMVFVRTSGDTAFIKIPEATYLTQQMGSTGPDMFLAGVVFTITSLPGLNYVNFDFTEGDHASPGTFSRETFKNL